MDDVIAQLINSSVPVDDFQGVIKSYARLPYDKNAVAKVKECYLAQSEETLDNYQVMMVITHFPFFVLYNYIFEWCTHIFIYHIYIYVCTYLRILYIYIRIYLYISIFIYSHAYISINEEEQFPTL